MNESLSVDEETDGTELEHYCSLHSEEPLQANRFVSATMTN